MAGVTAARDLSRAGLRVCVLEARQRLGGRIHTLHDLCGSAVEAGAELIHGPDAPTIAEVRAAGLTVRPNSHAVTAMRLDLGGGCRWAPLELAHPQSWGAFGILRDLARPQPSDISAREFVERQGYRGRARALAKLVLTSHPPGDESEIGIHGFVKDGVLALERSADFRINEGYDRLVEAIATGLDVEYGFDVETIAWSNTDVVVRDSRGRERSARAAISTLPAGVLQARAVRFAPGLPPAKEAALRAMVSGAVLKLVMRFETAFWPASMAMVGSASGPVTLYWNVFYKAARAEPILTAYCTGDRARGLSQAGDETALSRVMDDVRRHFPRAKPNLVAWRLIDWSADPYARGGYTFLRPGAGDARARLAAADTGALFWAGSETGSEPIAATVAAAYTSGKRAAAQVRAVFGA